jgi:hypothetical protein
MAQNSHVEKKLKKKRRRELAAYFGTIVRKEGLLSAILRTMSYLRRRSG